MLMQLMQVQLSCYPAGVPEIDDETLATWRAFLNAHARVTRAIGRDLAAAGLPDLSWYDLLWALYRSRGEACASTSSPTRSSSARPP